MTNDNNVVLHYTRFWNIIAEMRGLERRGASIPFARPWRQSCSSLTLSSKLHRKTAVVVISTVNTCFTILNPNRHRWKPSPNYKARRRGRENCTLYTSAGAANGCCLFSVLALHLTQMIVLDRNRSKSISRYTFSFFFFLSFFLPFWHVVNSQHLLCHRHACSAAPLSRSIRSHPSVTVYGYSYCYP